MRAWNNVLNPKFLGSWDVPDNGTLIVKITAAKEELVDNFKTNKKEKKLIIYIENHKPLVCNITNAKAISLSLKTKDMDVWIGKYIEIGTKMIRAFGENTLALRVKIEAPKPPKPKGLPILSPKSERWVGAVQAVADGKTTLLKIRENFTLSEADAEQLTSEGMDYLENKENGK